MDRLKGRILIITTTAIIATLIILLVLCGVVIDKLLINEAKDRMEREVLHLEETLKKDNINIDQEIDGMGRTFSVVIAQKSQGIIYLSTHDLNDVEETKQVVADYWNSNFEEKFTTIDIEDLNQEVQAGDYYRSKNHYVLVTNLPDSKYFPKNSYLCILKDINYINTLESTMKRFLIFIFLILAIIQLWIIRYSLSTVFLALRELNLFAGEMSGSKVIDFSKRYDKRYENKEVDELIVALNNFIEKIEDSFGNMEEFSSNVSHELKTPIASMRSMIEVELVQDRSAEEYKEVLIKILEEINWMNNLIQKLLTLTKNPENLKKNFKPLELHKLSNEICDLMEIMALDGGIELLWDFDSIKGEFIMGDIGSLRQVVINLINNSIKYNKENGWIKISGKIVQDEIYLSIEDCGIGIKKENIAKLTDRFFREDNVRTHKKFGAGLGLAIVKHIIEAHRGKLIIESELGVGSTFTIIFPRIEQISVEIIE